MSGAMAARASDVEADKGRVAQTKVSRYRAGHAPKWAENQDVVDQSTVATATKERSRTEGIAAPVIVRKADDPRLRRLAQSNNQDEDREEALQRRREIRSAEIVRLNRQEEEGAAAGASADDVMDDDEGGDTLRRRDSDRSAGGAMRRRHAGEEGGGGDDDDGEPEERAGAKAVGGLRGRMQVPLEDEEDILRKRQAVKERCVVAGSHAASRCMHVPQSNGAPGGHMRRVTLCMHPCEHP